VAFLHENVLYCYSVAAATAVRTCNKTSDGYLLYEYDPERDIFVDSGYVKNLEDLDFKIRARYGFHKSVHLVESFEEVAKMFDSPLPRIVYLASVALCLASNHKPMS
jgi:hypothetical protein